MLVSLWRVSGKPSRDETTHSILSAQLAVPTQKKQRSDACQQVTESGAAGDCLETHAENKDGHNVLIYAEVEDYFPATSGNQAYPV